MKIVFNVCRDYLYVMFLQLAGITLFPVLSLAGNKILFIDFLMSKTAFYIIYTKGQFNFLPCMILPNIACIGINYCRAVLDLDLKSNIYNDRRTRTMYEVVLHLSGALSFTSYTRI